MTDDQQHIVVRTPVALVQHPAAPHRMDIFLKIFSWMTATFLAAAIVISLISGSIERNDLRNEVSEQSTELVCRTVAAAAVTEANTARDNTIAEAVIAVANHDDAEVKRLLIVLSKQTDAVNDAIAAQEGALILCAKH